MVWNEKLKRDIPKGWKECTLHRYIGRITNGLNPRQNFVLGTGSNFYVSIRSLEGRDINWESCEKCDDSALAKINSRSQLQCGDVIFSVQSVEHIIFKKIRITGILAKLRLL